jgi:hypothetical protein
MLNSEGNSYMQKFCLNGKYFERKTFHILQAKMERSIEEMASQEGF